ATCFIPEPLPASDRSRLATDWSGRSMALSRSNLPSDRRNRRLTGEGGLRCVEALSRIRRWANEQDLDFRHDTRTGFGAVFSRCGNWRYLLWRHGTPTGKLLGVGLLNPSRADETRDDPTIRQCRSRARQAGLSGVIVWNLFAWRATFP